MTHLVRTQSSYRKLLESPQVSCLQMKNGSPLPTENDYTLTTQQISTWLIIVETPHEAWFWEPGTSPQDKKWWYRAEKNIGLPSPYEERPDLSLKQEGFLVERAENLDDWPRSNIVCIDFAAKMKQQLKSRIPTHGL